MTVGPGAFIGRGWERDEIAAVITKSQAGNGELVLIGGEAGIGKTRLAREATNAATAAGCTVVWAACWEGDDAPPYWPWVQVVRSMRDVLDAEPDPEHPIDRRALGVVMPELSDDPPLESHDNPAAIRSRVFGAVVALLTAVSDASPLVIVLDDLHWADEPSLLLLRDLSSQLPTHAIAVIGTYRDTEVDIDPARSVLFLSLRRGCVSRSGQHRGRRPRRLSARGATRRAVRDPHDHDRSR
jgi:eukaryotic-like serine/threonine-protein kinase